MCSQQKKIAMAYIGLSMLELVLIVLFLKHSKCYSRLKSNKKLQQLLQPWINIIKRCFALITSGDFSPEALKWSVSFKIINFLTVVYNSAILQCIDKM